MSHLVLELRPGEMMVVNGATIRFRSRCRVELVSKARFLFGKQIMAAHEAETTISRLYYALQIAYAGTQEELPDARTMVDAMLRRLEREQPADLGPEVAPALAAVRSAIEGADFYSALKILRSIIRLEKARNLPS